MALRKILVPLSGEGREDAALESAVAIARDVGAHIEAMFMRHDPREAVNYATDYFSAATLEQVMGQIEARNKESGASARRRFDAALAQHPDALKKRKTDPGFSAAYVERTGMEMNLVLQHGRVSDLIVMEKPGPADDSHISNAMHAALRYTGRPVLVVPSIVRPLSPRRIAIAWNGSLEATRAVACAIPLIERAEEVVVLIAGGRDTDDLPEGDLLDYLGCHGTQARAFRIGGGAHRSDGEEILAALSTYQIDLAVLGAYTRGDLKRLIFGGVTGTLLRRTDRPLLMVH